METNMYPEEVVDQLRNLQGRYLHETDTGYLNLGVLENAPVKKYRTGLTDPRIVIRSALNKFLARKAADPKSSIFEMGEKEWVMYCSDPIYYISDGSILRVLTGKGTVEEIKDVLKIVSLMLQEQKPNKALRGCASLRQFVDDYVGHDCNGFVFSYLRATHNYQATSDKKCGQYREGILRRTVQDIQELDLVFPSDGGHILIIGRVWNRTSGSIECMISESRDPTFGGPQSHRYRVKLKDGKWNLDFLDRSEYSRTMGTIYGSPLTWD